MSRADEMMKDKISGRRGGGGGVEKLPKHRIEQDGRSQHHPQGWLQDDDDVNQIKSGWQRLGRVTGDEDDKRCARSEMVSQ